MNLPTDYATGYEKALALEPDLASTYIAHTVIGDPEADAMMAEVSALGPPEARRILAAGMNREHATLREAPAVARIFFQSLDAAPDWVNHKEFDPGIRMFHRNSRLVSRVNQICRISVD